MKTLLVIIDGAADVADASTEGLTLFRQPICLGGRYDCLSFGHRAPDDIARWQCTGE